MIQTIVVGSDGSDRAQGAVRWASELAGRLGARVMLVYAIAPLPAAASLGYTMYVPDGVGPAEIESELARVRSEFTEPLRTAGVRWDVAVMRGHPAEVIAHMAHEAGADLIVVGTRGLHGLAEVVRGSTSHNLSTHVAIPVVLVPAPAPALSSGPTKAASAG